MLRFFLLLLLLNFPIAAQSLSSSKDPSATGGRPQSTGVSFFELMESGGESFLDLFRGNQEGENVDNPRWDSYKSPRETVLTFTNAMNHVLQGRDKAWPRALEAIEGSGASEERYEAARKLMHVFDRLPEIAPNSLPDEGLTRSKNISRYQFFPRGIDAEFVYTVLDSPPKGEIDLRLKDGKWVFTVETIEGIDDLLESLMMIPPRKRIERRGELFTNAVLPTFQETPIWNWFKALGAAAVGFVVAYFAGKGLGWLANKLKPVDHLIISPLLDGLRFPVTAVLAGLGLMIASEFIHWEPALSSFRWTVLKAIFTLGIVWMVVSVIELSVVGLQRAIAGKDNPYGRMLSTVVRRVIRLIATIVIIIFLIQNVLEWNITTILGGLGILALAVSLAARDAVANLFGAITIFANRPFVSGDWVQFEGKWGEIEDVSIQVTRIRLLSGELWSVPNMRFVDKPVENLSERQYLRRVIHIAIPYDTSADDMKRAIDITDDILRSDEVCKDNQCDPEEFPPKVMFEDFESDHLQLRVDYRYLMDSDTEESKIQRETDRSYITWLEHCSLVNLKIKERFDQEGIGFAFPTQTIKLEQAS